MSVQRNIELIQEILANLDKKHGTRHEQLTYELGYLIGVLARIANDNNETYKELKNILARQKFKK
jgi:hypothetical protein